MNAATARKIEPDDRPLICPRGWFVVDLAMMTALAVDIVRTHADQCPIVAVIEGGRARPQT